MSSATKAKTTGILAWLLLGFGAVLLSDGLAPTLAGEFPAILDPSTLDGTAGVTVKGDRQNDRLGFTVSRAGDVNADGRDDFVVGGFARLRGQWFVVFGTDRGFPAEVHPKDLDGSNGFALLVGRLHDGGTVSAVGDVNGDGIDDLAVAHTYGGDPFSPLGYVVFGRCCGFAPLLEVSTLNGTDGFALMPGEGILRGAESVSPAGDLNDDGIDDLMISAPYGDGGDKPGVVWVVFGRTTGFPASLDLVSLDGADGFSVAGSADDVSFLGVSLCGSGDLDGDGLDDIVLGDGGRAFVILGDSGGFPASFDIASLDGTNGFAIDGLEPQDSLGASVSNAGDLNGDGIDDLAIGAPGATVDGEPAVGATYVIYGTAAGFPASFDLGTLDGTNGVVFVGVSGWDRAGASVSVLGDLNADDVDDLLIGAAGPIPTSDGHAYVVFGRHADFPASVRLSTLDGNDGFVIRGFALEGGLGFSVSGAGDVDADGIDDLVVGAPMVDSAASERSGEAYVVFGKADCAVGRVNAGLGGIHPALFVNGSTGGDDRTVELGSDELLEVTVLRPLGGGNGRFVVHGDEGDSRERVSTTLPLNVGFTCSPFLLGQGASPVIVANNVGRSDRLGRSMFYGYTLEDPPVATTTLSYPPLPLGTVLTFQGILIDPGAISTKGASTTNAVVVRVVR